MFTSIRGRTVALLSVCALAMAFPAVRPSTAHAAPAYSDGYIAYGTGTTKYWNVVDPNSGATRMIAPSGYPYDSMSHYVHTLSYSPDASEVAFVAEDISTRVRTLWVTRSDGIGAREIANGGSDRVAWTPDGSQVLFGTSDGIEAVPAAGGAPTHVVSDPCGASPQETTRGYIFYERTCPGQSPSMAVYRPGDAEPSAVSADVGAVSRDGSLLARLVRKDFMTTSVVEDEIGGSGRSWQAASVNSTLEETAVTYGPSGALAIGYRRCCMGPYYYGIVIAGASAPAANRQILFESGYAPKFMDWVNGPSNLPIRAVADRVEGIDRIATGISASRWAFDSLGTPGRRAAVAVLSRDDQYPDALAGTALAVEKGGPLLLTPRGGLDRGVSAELKRVLAPGSTVYLLGGPAALSPAVADAVRTLGFNPVRLGGPDRYATAVAIATAISGAHPKTVLLATGTDFPDALAAGTAAGQERYSVGNTDNAAGGVVLLTEGTRIPDATLAYLNRVQQPGSTTLYAVGGPAAAAMRSLSHRWSTQVPLVGSDRYATALKVAASALYGNGAPGRYTMAGITTGLNFPDALTGGALAGSRGAPLLLADAGGLTPAESAYLHGQQLDDIVVIGGPAAVSDHSFAAIADNVFSGREWNAQVNRSAPPLP